MKASPTIQDRILERFLKKMEANQVIPRELLGRLQKLYDVGQIQKVERILSAVEEGIKEHASNSPA